MFDAEIALGVFITVFNILILVDHRVAIVVIAVVGRLRDFYGIGRMSSAGLPQFVQDLYATLAVFILDVEFLKTGCQQ